MPIVKQRPGNKGKNQTLMFLAQISDSVEKIIHLDLIEGGMKTEDFHKFLSDFNPPNNGKKNVLIMDNLRVHKAKQSCIDLGLPTIEELLTSKDIEVIFLPSYTPELNPIEKINHIIKDHVRKEEARNKEKLRLTIEEKVKFFQKEDLNTYLDNSVNECLMKLNSTVQFEGNTLI
ncbi:MAG: transposase [Mollicutes bacterium UO1]